MFFGCSKNTKPIYVGNQKHSSVVYGVAFDEVNKTVMIMIYKKPIQVFLKTSIFVYGYIKS